MDHYRKQVFYILLPFVTLIIISRIADMESAKQPQPIHFLLWHKYDFIA